MKSTHIKIMKIPKRRMNKGNSRLLTTLSGECEETFKKSIILTKKGEVLRWLLVFEKSAPKTVQIAVTLAAQETQAHIGLLWRGTKNMASDINLTVTHEGAKTESRVIFGATLEGAARVYFRGLAHVGKKAVASRTHCSAKALMLSPRSIAVLQPDLEVATSETIAGHGSSVGRPSDKELFYFTARGISEAHAKRMMRDAFIQTITNEIALT